MNAVAMIQRCAERQNVDPDFIPGSVLPSPADSTPYIEGPTDHGVEGHHALGMQEYDTVTAGNFWA